MVEFSAEFLNKQTTQNFSVSAQKTDNFVFWTWCCSNRILVLQRQEKHYVFNNTEKQKKLLSGIGVAATQFGVAATLIVVLQQREF